MLPTLLKNYKPYDDTEAAIARQFTMFLSDTKTPYDRGNLVAHVVADAWIVNPARTHVVLVEHGLDGRWCAPGGHCDGNPDVMAGALREAEEEAGLINLKPLLNGNIFDLNSNSVPFRQKEWGPEPAHIHFDVCFAFESPDNAPLKVSHESTDLKWVAIKDIRGMNFHPDHMRRVAKTLAGVLG